jgi:hypothetical protein
MQNNTLSSGYAHCTDDFYCRVLNQFSRWHIGVDYMLNLLELSKSDIERLDAIEDCLREFGKFTDDPKEFPWHDTSDEDNSLIHNDSFIMECKDLLDELDEIKCEVLHK